MKKIICLLVCVFGLYACNPTTKDENKPVLSVTIEPLCYFVEAVAGDSFRVVSMVPEGVSPETYDPSPVQMMELGRSKALFGVGYIGFEQAWMGRIAENFPGLQIFDTSAGIDLIRGDHHHHDEGHSHHEAVEPHVWSSPVNALLMARNVCDALCKMDEENSAAYRQRTDSLCHVISETQAKIADILVGADSTFLIYHPALSYFARDYGLHQVSIEEGGKEPSPARLKELIDFCRNEQVKVIFVQQEFDRRHAETLSRELGVQVVSIHPLSRNWDAEMIRIARSLKHE